MVKQKYNRHQTDDIPFPDKAPLPPSIRPTPARTFCAGDVVYLKSGSSRMTIERMEHTGEGDAVVEFAHCVFSVFGSYDVRRVVVAVVALKHA
jgi:hypothetical protein